MQQPFFCSELSRRAGEKIFGTASTGGTWLLLEYAGAWGPRALEQSALAAGVKAFLQRTLRSIPHSRLLFIKRGRAGGHTFSFFVVRTRERDPFAVRYELDSYASLVGLDVARAAAGDPGPAPDLPREVLVESSFRAGRDGLAATVWHDGALRPVRERIAAAVELARPHTDAGALEEVERIVREGNGADRMRAAHAEGGMPRVLRQLIAESADPLGAPARAA
jgi:hypothetical protein